MSGNAPGNGDDGVSVALGGSSFGSRPPPEDRTAMRIELIEHRVAALEDTTKRIAADLGATRTKVDEANIKIAIMDAKLDSVASAAAVAELRAMIANLPTSQVVGDLKAEVAKLGAQVAGLPNWRNLVWTALAVSALSAGIPSLLYFLPKAVEEYRSAPAPTRGAPPAPGPSTPSLPNTP